MAKLTKQAMEARKLIERYNAVSAYIHNQTDENWKELEKYVIGQLNDDISRTVIE